MTPSHQERVPTKLTVDRVRVWPCFIKGDAFPAGYVAEARLAETGGFRFGVHSEKPEGAVDDLNLQLSAEGVENYVRTVQMLEGCPDVEPRVVAFETWNCGPHTNDPAQAVTHARRVMLTTGASVSVTHLMSAKGAQAAVQDAIMNNMDRVKYKCAIIISHTYDPHLKQTTEPEL